MRKRLGSANKLAVALKIARQIVDKTCADYKRTKATAAMAIRIARLAGVPIEDVLTGTFPAPGVCPHCGRGKVPLLGTGS